jgi:hypothetical protein
MACPFLVDWGPVIVCTALAAVLDGANDDADQAKPEHQDQKGSFECG